MKKGFRLAAVVLMAHIVMVSHGFRSLGFRCVGGHVSGRNSRFMTRVVRNLFKSVEDMSPNSSNMNENGKNICGDSSASSLQLIGYKNTQKKVDLNKEYLVQSTSILLSILNVPEFKVDIWFCSESKIRQLNWQYRNVNKSTDVLSFPANDFLSPEEFDPDDPSLEFEKHLGDIVISPKYVERACERDALLNDQGKLHRSDDRGCYREMKHIFSAHERIPLLLIHGLLHLLGYDHEGEEEWIDMTKKEAEVLQKFRQAWQLRNMVFNHS